MSTTSWRKDAAQGRFSTRFQSISLHSGELFEAVQAKRAVAQTQNDLGVALPRLGQRESDTAKINEAVEALTCGAKAPMLRSSA